MASITPRLVYGSVLNNFKLEREFRPLKNCSPCKSPGKRSHARSPQKVMNNFTIPKSYYPQFDWILLTYYKIYS